MAEKRREKKRHSRQKQREEKDGREEEKVQEKQAMAMAGMSEREKRAMAAEKRMAQRMAHDSSVQRYCRLYLYDYGDFICSICSSTELEFVPVVGVVWLAWFHSTDFSTGTAPCHVCGNTGPSWPASHIHVASYRSRTLLYMYITHNVMDHFYCKHFSWTIFILHNNSLKIYNH